MPKITIASVKRDYVNESYKNAFTTGLSVVAHYNPESIDMSRSTKWADPFGDNSSAAPSDDDSGGSSGNKKPMNAQFKGTTGFSLSLKLIFDDYMDPRDQGPGTLSCADSLNVLNILSFPDETTYPPAVYILFGSYTFQAVIKKLRFNISAVDSNLRPTRATVSLTLMEYFGGLGKQENPYLF